MRRGIPELSLVVPVMNEAGSVTALAAEIGRALDVAGIAWECVWVDDASSDGTPAALARIHDDDPRHRPLAFTRHHGQSAALWVGFQHAQADLCATMDGDGQNDPADLVRILRELETTGADMVVGIRERRHDPWIRLWSARVAAVARRLVLGETLHDAASPVRVFRRECLRGVFPFNGLHRFLAILAVHGGFRVGQLPVSHRPRVTGVSKYGVGNRLGIGLADLVGVAWMRRRALRVDPGNVRGEP